jgi:hypothetical protein
MVKEIEVMFGKKTLEGNTRNKKRNMMEEGVPFKNRDLSSNTCVARWSWRCPMSSSYALEKNVVETTIGLFLDWSFNRNYCSRGRGIANWFFFVQHQSDRRREEISVPVAGGTS